MTDFVDVVVQQLINEVDMGQEHSPATVSGKAKGIKDFANVLFFLHLFGSFSDQLTEFLPFMCDHFTTTKTTDGDDHFDIFMMIFKGFYDGLIIIIITTWL